MGRKRAEEEMAHYVQKRRYSVFSYHALRIQGCYRGYYSRTNKHDFRARKNYIRRTIQKGKELQTSMAARLYEQEEVRDIYYYCF